jgi:hypothetical protein
MVGDGSVITPIVRFLGTIGLTVRWGRLDEPTRLPGINIDRGSLLIDRGRLQHPGDILHEGGHLAVIPADERAQVIGDAGSDPAREMMAIAWSYAALRHLRLDPTVVFHDDGYRGGSRNLIENFTAGRYIGVPVLQWLGMTADTEHAAELGIEPYPAMRNWLL